MPRGVAIGSRWQSETGSAVVEFALISVVLIPLFVGLLQVGLFLHVRNTMTSCAHDGARIGASVNRDFMDAEEATRNCINNTLGSAWQDNVSNLNATIVDGPEGTMVEVSFRGYSPTFVSMFGLDLTMEVEGHAIDEPEVP